MQLEYYILTGFFCDTMNSRSGKSISKERGDIGESFACDLLRKKGYRIISRNWRCRWGEIDIIAQDGDVIVFVEVKSAKSKYFGNPARWVDSRKQSHLVESAMQYISDEIGEDVPVRFDVVAVNLNKMNAEHIINAFSVEFE